MELAYYTPQAVNNQENLPNCAVQTLICRYYSLPAISPASRSLALNCYNMPLQKHIVKVFEFLQKNKPRLDTLAYACLIHYY